MSYWDWLPSEIQEYIIDFKSRFEHEEKFDFVKIGLILYFECMDMERLGHDYHISKKHRNMINSLKWNFHITWSENYPNFHSETPPIIYYESLKKHKREAQQFIKSINERLISLSSDCITFNNLMKYYNGLYRKLFKFNMKLGY